MRTDNEELMKNIHNNDPEAFKALLLKYDKLLYSIAYDVLKDDMHAQDAVMETFEQLIRKCKTIRNEEKLKSWLCATVFRKALNILNKNKRLIYMDVYELEFIADKFNTDNNDADEKIHIQDCLSQLPDEQIEVLMLEYEGFKLREISEIMDFSIEKVRGLLKKAKNNFKNFWKN